MSSSHFYYEVYKHLSIYNNFYKLKQLYQNIIKKGQNFNILELQNLTFFLPKMMFFYISIQNQFKYHLKKKLLSTVISSTPSPSVPLYPTACFLSIHQYHVYLIYYLYYSPRKYNLMTRNTLFHVYCNNLSTQKSAICIVNI